jgi:NAD(P)-dependent dehydrogenase (short-subunit alcohol dehydrogenase family)
MLDSDTHKAPDAMPAAMPAMMPVLKGRRIIVLGACCGFGRAMIRTLAMAGAQVVAADSDVDALSALEGGAMPLTLRGAPEASLRRAGRAWGEARLDSVLNLMPLRHPDRIDMNIAVLQSVVQGFMPALAASQGQIVSVVARPDEALDVAAGAMGPALLSANAAFAHALRRDGLTLNTVTVGDGGLAGARIAVTGLLSGALGRLSGSDLRV